MNGLNEEFGTQIHIDKIKIGFFGDVNIKNVLINDHKKDSLFYVKNLRTNIINAAAWYQGDLYFGKVILDGFKMKMINYKGEKFTNLDLFVEAFEEENDTVPSDFFLKINKAILKNSHYLFYDYNSPKYRLAEFTQINGTAKDLMIKGPNVYADIKSLALKDYRGLYIKDLRGLFSYTLKNILIQNTVIITEKSRIEGHIALRYKREDFSDFNNKVLFDVNIKKASIASADIKHFYNELGKGLRFHLNTKIKGTLNDLTFKRLDLEGNHGTELIGDINFKNIFGKTVHQPFSMKGSLRKLTLNSEGLIRLLPNLLKDKLPEQIASLKDINARGDLYVTTDLIDSDLELMTDLGAVHADFLINGFQNMDNALYKGVFQMDQFQLGELIQQKDLGKVTSDLKIDGRGFTQKTLNTKIEGKIASIEYHNYRYTNIDLNGSFKMPVFEGIFEVDDPNLKMSFDGLVSIDGKENQYVFQSEIAHADLYELKWSKKDTISLLKGSIDINMTGSTIDNVYGKISIKNASYINPSEIYEFNDFEIESRFDQQNIRTITVNSPDIIQGELKGHFYFKELKKVIENSLGGIYANYNPHKISNNQHLTFNFNIYNKIIDIFLPEVSFGKNTMINGKISTADNDFKLNFISPELIAYKNYVYNINLGIDNKNPEYKTLLSADSITSKRYKVSQFVLKNSYDNDTLRVSTAFKGGKQMEDTYHLNLFHTINAKKQSVVGFKKSTVDFKSYQWVINESSESENTVVFGKTLDKFVLNNISATHANGFVKLNGVVKDSTYKNLQLSFKDVPVDKITPTIDNLHFKGSLNGVIDFVQEKQWYKPTASININRFSINDYDLGRFDLDIKGDPFLKNFEINSKIQNESLESLTAFGNISIENNQSLIDLDVKLNDFNMATLSPLGGSVVNNIEGKLSGRTSFIGPIDNPEVNGRFYIDEGSLKVPYLNVVYKLDPKSVVDVTGTKFMFRNVNLYDQEFKTPGKLNGSITHEKFSDWYIDLKVNANKLLVLDTQDSEEAVYYGKAFVLGEAKIKGPTHALVIDVKAKSQKGTEIKIPINDSESLGDNTYIKFMSEKEKYHLNENIQRKEVKEYKGLEMVFDFDITPDAVIEVILDRQSGHGLKGRGFGNILLNINTLGKFNMWGDFLAHQGVYHFKYGGLIDKRFEVTSGGSIRWEGDPLRAILNLEAVYKTQANPSVLIDNPSFNRTVPVNVKIKLTDQLIKPEIDFIIDFPTVSSVLKSEIQYKLDEKNIRQTQAMYLLSSGGFLSTTNAGQNAVTGNLFERASGLLNDVLDDEDSKFKVGVNYVQQNRTAYVKTEGRVGLTFSSQINERISVNGKFGVPTGGVSRSGVIGEGNVDWRLSKDNSLHARFFNRENDINYLGEVIGYTQGVGLNYQIEFNNFKSLLAKLKQKQSPVPLDNQEIKLPDSFITPERIEVPKKKADVDQLFEENIPVFE